MKPWTKDEYVSLIRRCDSAATVSKTSEDFAGPGHAGEHGEAAFRDRDRDVPQVVLVRAGNNDYVVGVSLVLHGCQA